MDTGTPTIVQKPTSPIAPPLPTVSQERGAEQRPQVFPNIISYPKSSTMQSLPSTSTALPTSSKPISTAPQDLEPQSQAHAEALARLGIKVRDFAYESTLPPVQPFRRRQFQPVVSRPLKRVTRDGEEDDTSGPGSSKDGDDHTGISTKKARLEREITEPDIQQSSAANPPVRERVFMNLNDYEPISQSQSSGASSQPSELQVPLQDVESKYIDTPLVTPSSLTQWTVRHNVPLSGPQPHSASQLNEAMLSLSSEPGPSEPRDRTGLLGPLTPMSSLSSIQSDPPTSPVYPPPAAISSRLLHVPKYGPSLSPPRSLNQSPSRPLSGSPRPNTRYHLRRRTAAISSQSPVKPTTRNHRVTHSTPHPASRPLAYSRQSSHSRTKAQSTSDSPRARTLRKRVAGPSDRDESAGL